MEGFALLIVLIAYLVIRILLSNSEDQTAKDARTYQAGINLVKHKKYEAAFEYFNNVLKDKPKCALAYAYRGKCNLATGDLYAAIYDCTEATSYDHCIAEAYLNKGIALYKLELYKDAFLEFDKAVWHYRNNAVAFRWRAITRIQMGMADKAEKDLKRAVELGDEDSNFYLLSQGRVDINSLLR
jgi:tetratricopeptide (TPR) repeat protein